ncbi:hypothetical protein H2203_001846 [Taxawa tesnikishii (nom. ined.)]|nr:hypothetical protein H2203_001846 [Dothideales sp. JES 119]
MGPEKPLPISPEWSDSMSYAESLLDFVQSSDLLRTLCGGVHILDFFTRKPDLYSQVLPEEWRTFFQLHDIMDILDLFMRDDLASISQGNHERWRGDSMPPESLIEHLQAVRKYSLHRDFVPPSSGTKNGQRQKLARHVTQGMNVKRSMNRFSKPADYPFGRFWIRPKLPWASSCKSPFNKHIIAVESRQHNIEGARNWDILAKLAPKPQINRNKKEYRAQLAVLARGESPQPPIEEEESLREEKETNPLVAPVTVAEDHEHKDGASETPVGHRANLQISAEGVGTIQYVEHWIQDGNLSAVVDQIVDEDTIRSRASNNLNGVHEAAGTSFVEGSIAVKEDTKASDPRLMVMSLHSCGNLVHHGLRTLLLNPAVSAVAMIGCCYNLLSERLGPTTYKHPRLRSYHPRLGKTAQAFDPHGFPMSDRLCNYEHGGEKGLRLNITARMMAVQAPQNWGKKDSDDFFTRHFFRALLQRIFLDRGIVDEPGPVDDVVGGSPLGFTGGTAPIIIGSLRKSCYNDFVSYVRGATAKLVHDPDRGTFFEEKMRDLTDEEIRDYERRYAHRKKELSVIWSLMAFSAAVVEATIVVDRWLWLKEQKEVAEAWVEPVFDYKQSPRNLVIVGIKH